MLVAPLHQEVPAVGIGEVVAEAHPCAPGERVVRVGQQVQRCVGDKRSGAVRIARIAGQALEAQRRHRKAAADEHLLEGVRPLLVGGDDAEVGLGRLRIFGVHGEQVARQPVEFLVRRVPLHGGDVAYGSLALVGRKRLLVARADNGIAERGDVGIAESGVQGEHGHVPAQGVEGGETLGGREARGDAHGLVGIAGDDELIAGEQTQAGLLCDGKVLEVVGEHEGEPLSRAGARITLQVAPAEVGHLVFQHGVRGTEQAMGQLQHVLLLAHGPVVLGGERAPLLLDMAELRAQAAGGSPQGLHVLQEEVALEGREHAGSVAGGGAGLGRFQHGKAHLLGAGHGDAAGDVFHILHPGGGQGVHQAATRHAGRLGRGGLDEDVFGGASGGHGGSSPAQQRLGLAGARGADDFGRAAVESGDFCHHVSHECLLIGQDAAGRVEIARGAIGVDDRPLIEGEGEIGIGQGVLLLDVLA